MIRNCYSFRSIWVHPRFSSEFALLVLKFSVYFFCPFSFGHSVVLSSDNPFGIFKFSFKQGWSTIPTKSTFVWFINWKCVLFIKIDKFIMQWRTAGQRFSPCTLVSSTNKTDRHDILKYCWIVLNTINQTIWRVIKQSTDQVINQSFSHLILQKEEYNI